jgi:hypothetical protein
VDVQLGLGHFAQELGQTVGGNGVNFEHGFFLARLDANQEIVEPKKRPPEGGLLLRSHLLRNGIQL